MVSDACRFPVREEGVWCFNIVAVGSLHEGRDESTRKGEKENEPPEGRRHLALLDVWPGVTDLPPRSLASTSGHGGSAHGGRSGVNCGRPGRRLDSPVQPGAYRDASWTLWRSLVDADDNQFGHGRHAGHSEHFDRNRMRSEKNAKRDCNPDDARLLPGYLYQVVQLIMCLLQPAPRDLARGCRSG